MFKMLPKVAKDFIFWQIWSPLLRIVERQDPRHTCGQCYKASTIVIYDPRVIPDLKILPITTLES